mgnify:CR=1 FL=1|tara:strand:- start:723 stop:1097 length:375 start_codon:yes stop_codon:yes gene_type:complete
MANDQLKDLHLKAMQSVLPVGMGIIKNAKAGGLKKIIDVLSSPDPFSEFQVDGETSAKTLRDQIDQLIPGLGNPVVSVDVTVEDNITECEINDKDSLVSTLTRIDVQLNELRKFLENDIKRIDD